MTSNEDEPLVLDLDDEDRAKYEEFIESLIGKFPPCVVEKDLRNLDKEGAGAEIIFRKFKSEIEKCFPEMFRETAESPEGEGTDKKNVPRTYSPEELKDKNWLLPVRLVHKGRNLDILIKKNNLYLVGYKGKYKFTEKDGTVDPETEQAERWIVLAGKDHDEVVKSVQKFLQPDLLKAVKLSTSYSALFGKSKDYAPESDSDLSKELQNKLQHFKGIALREEERNIDYAQKKLGEIKMELESKRGAGENGNIEELDYEELIKRVDKLLGKLPKSVTREQVNELEGDDNRAARDFLNHLKKPQQEHIPAENLIQKLQNKHEKYIKQVQEASENQRDCSFQKLLNSWVEVFPQTVVILGRLTDGSMDNAYSGNKMRKRSSKGLEKELKAMIKLIRMLEKKLRSAETLKTNPITQYPKEEILKDFSSEEDMLKDLYDETVKKEENDEVYKEKILKEIRSKKDTLKNLYDKAVKKEDQAKFHQEHQEMSKVLEQQMHSVKEDAEIIRVKKSMAYVKLNRLAFTEAVDCLTTSSFDEGDGKFADHIIKLAVMICEAVRFPDIAEHVASNYRKKTHEDTDRLSPECITSIYHWRYRSTFMLRGGVYVGERRLMGGDPAVIKQMDADITIKE